MLWAFCTASPSCLGRPTEPGRAASGADGALNSTMTTSSRSGRRQRACAARCSTAGCCPTFEQCLLHRSSRCNRLRGPARTSRFASAAYYFDTRVGSPPASPAVGPGGATLVGSVLSRLCSAAWLTQSAADAAWGCRRGCCSARCAEGVAILSSPSRRRHLLLAAALPFPSIAQTHTHTRTHTHIINDRVLFIIY